MSDPYAAYVTLLCHFDGTNGQTTTTDSSLFAHPLGSVFSGALLDTSVKKFGTASLKSSYIGGSVQIVSADAMQPEFDFSLARDFTVEAWVYIDATDIGTSMTFIDVESVHGVNRPTLRMSLSTSGSDWTFSARGYHDNSSTPVFQLAGATIIPGNQWHHYALTRTGTTYRIFLDGNLEDSATSSTTLDTPQPTNRVCIGGAPSVEYMSGWVDEARFTMGVSRYTANFTPPSAPFDDPTPDTCDDHYTDVTVLAHMDGGNAGDIFPDDSSYAHTLTQEPLPSATPRPQTEVSVVRVGSAATYFPGGGTYLWAANSPELDVSNTAVDYTLECWFYVPAPAVPANAISLAKLGTTGVSGAQVWLHLNNGGGFFYLRAMGGTSGSVFDTFSLPKTPITGDVWHHAALARVANVYYLFLDGFLLGSVTPTGSLPGTVTRQFAIGGDPSTGAIDPVYIDDFRFTNGTGRYTTSFLPVPIAYPDVACFVPPPAGTVFLYGTFVPSSEFKAIEMDRMGTIRPHIYAPVPNRTVRTKS